MAAIDSVQYPRKQKFHLYDKMHPTSVLWASPISKELNKADSGGTVNINHMCTYIVMRYVNETKYAYTNMQNHRIIKT